MGLKAMILVLISVLFTLLAVVPEIEGAPQYDSFIKTNVSRPHHLQRNQNDEHRGGIHRHSSSPVHTTTGNLKGIRRNVLGKEVHVFYGIPYAKAPLGPLRFKKVWSTYYQKNRKHHFENWVINSIKWNCSRFPSTLGKQPWMLTINQTLVFKRLSKLSPVLRARSLGCPTLTFRRTVCTWISGYPNRCLKSMDNRIKRCQFWFGCMGVVTFLARQHWTFTTRIFLQLKITLLW